MSNNVIDLSTYLERSNSAILKSGGGGGTSDGMEARVAVLETNIGHIKENLAEIRKDVRDLRSDLRSETHDLRAQVENLRAQAEKNFRLLFGALISVALGLGSLMLTLAAKGFHWF
jgi:hypothetical protein